jgi:hypothetical protein
MLSLFQFVLRLYLQSGSYLDGGYCILRQGLKPTGLDANSIRRPFRESKQKFSQNSRPKFKIEKEKSIGKSIHAALQATYKKKNDDGNILLKYLTTSFGQAWKSSEQNLLPMSWLPWGGLKCVLYRYGLFFFSRPVALLVQSS